MAGTVLPGNCYLCGRTISKAAFKKHILSDHAYQESDGQDCTVLKIEGADDKNYWLYLDIPVTSTLKSLDTFLREIWLECCGHMSAFYGSNHDEIGKSAKIASFPVGSKLLYEYDFGDTTSLLITVAAYSCRPKQRKAVRLLARNIPYSFVCGHCGRPADMICCECMWGEDNPFLCEDCVEEHEHESMLLIVNSPRMGVCGYCGELDVYEFNPAKFAGKK